MNNSKQTVKTTNRYNGNIRAIFMLTRINVVLIKFAVLNMSLLMAPSANSASITANKGEDTFIINQASDMSLNILTESSSNEGASGASVFAFTTSSYTTYGLYCGFAGSWMTQQGMPVYTVNGRSGIKVGTGIVLIPANGQFSGQVSIARKTYSGSASTSSLGSLQLSNAYSGPSNWCVQNVPASSPSGIRNTGFYAGNFSLSWYVYVDPSVAVGTIASVPTFYVSRSIVGSGWGVAKSIAANISGYQIKVTSTTCTLSTPSQIQFGTIDAGSTAPVISSDSGLDISCNGVAPTVNVSYTAQAVSATQTPTQLVMSNTQNQTLGMVRGFIGTNADSEVGCNDAVTSLKFGAPATNLLTAAANNTAHKIPLKWVLCPSSYAVPGQGVASATLDIIWQ